MDNKVKHTTDLHSGLLYVFYALVITSLAGWVITINGLGPLDDHQFISTLFQGKCFGAYFSPELGRFFPLTAQEFVFASWLYTPSPPLFFAINAFKVILLGFVLHRCLALTKINTLSLAVLWSLPLLSIGLANSVCRLHVGELNILLLTLVMAWSTLSIESRGDVGSTSDRFRAFVGVAALVVAFFYKELAFVFALSFGASELVRHYRRAGKMASIRLWAILLAGALYVAGYSLWRSIYCTGAYSGFHDISLLDILLLFSRNDPFIIFIVLPLLALRLLLIIRNATHHTVYDSFLVAATAYSVAFITLGMYNTYYLLPSYGFAVCGVAGIFALPAATGIYKRLVITGSTACCVYTLPIAFSDIQSLHETANNHYRFVHALSEWVWKNPMENRKPRHLVLVGVTPGNGVEVLVSLKTFLLSLGTPDSSFQVIAAEATDNRKISTFYNVGNTAGYKPVKNDLLIFNPYQNVVSRPPMLSPSYHEVLRSESEYALPRWSSKEWVHFYLRNPHTFSALLSDNMRYSGYAALLLDRSAVLTTSLVPLQSTAYQTGPITLPSRMRVGTSRQVDVLIENTGKEVWPSNGTLSPGMFVNISYRWFNADNQMILDGDRSPIPEPMQPHDIAKVSIVLVTPKKTGKYKLLITPVQEGVQWFPGVKPYEIEIY